MNANLPRYWSFSTARRSVRWMTSNGENTRFASCVAFTYSVLIVIYYVMKNKVPYKELGEDFFDRLNASRLARYYKRRLETLGFEVSLQLREQAA